MTQSHSGPTDRSGGRSRTRATRSPFASVSGSRLRATITMTWDAVRTGFWFVPGLLAVLAAALGLAMPALDAAVHGGPSSSGSGTSRARRPRPSTASG